MKDDKRFDQLMNLPLCTACEGDLGEIIKTGILMISEEIIVSAA